MQKNNPLEESDLDRASMWKKARIDKKEEYENEDIREIENRIVRHIIILHYVMFLSFINYSFNVFFYICRMRSQGFMFARSHL